MFDAHVHSAPCLFPRRGTDLETVAWYEAAGFSGCVLKGHFEPTAGRAAAVGAGLKTAVHGSVVLNEAVGGLNPAAVSSALELGARIVWMPTVDADTHWRAKLPRPPQLRGEARYGLPPKDWTTERAVRTIVALIAEADAVLGTGHLSASEIAWLIPLARGAGVRRIVLTHVFFTVPALRPADVRELVALGAHAEVTAFQLLHQPGMSAARLAHLTREAGLARLLLSSDAGQPDSPPGPEALALLTESLSREGLDHGALEAAASEIPERLLSL
jgi:hypothetical protein